jgi:hypothetical protein
MTRVVVLSEPGMKRFLRVLYIVQELVGVLEVVGQFEPRALLLGIEGVECVEGVDVGSSRHGIVSY